MTRAKGRKMMRKQLIESTALEVATQVRAVEDAIEEALAEIAELQGRMIRARATFGIATATGHAALEQLAETTVRLVQARGEMANCHMVLKETTQLVPGLRTVGFGDAQECPPQQGRADLRVVA
ncbi:hypothetical protein [Sphingomonas sp.]|uniref:hypothetical protein n=1 Tax=Sphingomonas sp. TaxID=28214 RepID=UPI0025D6EE8F|nr:hypothetical protein [Sphingomonas sp.]